MPVQLQCNPIVEALSPSPFSPFCPCLHSILRRMLALAQEQSFFMLFSTGSPHREGQPLFGRESQRWVPLSVCIPHLLGIDETLPLPSPRPQRMALQKWMENKADLAQGSFRNSWVPRAKQNGVRCGTASFSPQSLNLTSRKSPRRWPAGSQLPNTWVRCYMSLGRKGLGLARFRLKPHRSHLPRRRRD